ncbi:MAG: ATP-binding protein [Chloroflexi bacterium]|nr:ATP-binding protein [Chloroflexota bacterium]
MSKPETRTDRSSDLSSSSSGSRCVVIQMHGEPGSGKSTLASALAPRLGAVALDKDILKAALLRAGVAERQAAPAAYEAFFAQARALTAARHSVILDNPVYWESVERHWLNISDDSGSPRILIECVCPDRDVLVHRLSTRDAVESQPRDPLDLRRHPGAVATAYQPRLTLDTTRSLPDLIDEALAYIEASLDLPPPPTPNTQRLTTTTP